MLLRLVAIVCLGVAAGVQIDVTVDKTTTGSEDRGAPAPPAPPAARSRGPPRDDAPVAGRRGSPEHGHLSHPPTNPSHPAPTRAEPPGPSNFVSPNASSSGTPGTYHPRRFAHRVEQSPASPTLAGINRNRWPVSTGTGGRIHRNAHSRMYTPSPRLTSVIHGSPVRMISSTSAQPGSSPSKTRTA